MILLDANVLVYAVNSYAPQHTESRTVVEAAVAGDVPAVLVPQVLLEFFAVVTHPRRVQRPLDPQRAWEQVAALRTALPVLELRPSTLLLLDELVARHRPVGADIYDLFLAAQMRSHGVPTVCTYNPGDFAGLVGVHAATPATILAAGR